MSYLWYTCAYARNPAYRPLSVSMASEAVRPSQEGCIDASPTAHTGPAATCPACRAFITARTVSASGAITTTYDTRDPDAYLKWARTGATSASSITGL